ncbi:MAG: hypothetical protein ACLQVD_17010 [Capsulimonadaceae bacterium]
MAQNGEIMSSTASYRWQADLAKYSDYEQKVLIALSNDKYVWRSKERLAEVTGLDTDTLESTLGNLLSRSIVTPAISKRKNIIFALNERALRI